MDLLELILMSIGLAMDAFAVSICKGLSMQKINLKRASIVGLYFGGFQALMPTIGYFLGERFDHIIQNIDHWIIFIMLTIIGGNMIKESRQSKIEQYNDDTSFKTMIWLAIATSIDALAVGITFAFLDVNLVLAVSLIGLIALVFSMVGVKIGNQFGDRYKNKSELVGRMDFNFYRYKNFVGTFGNIITEVILCKIIF